MVLFWCSYVIITVFSSSIPVFSHKNVVLFLVPDLKSFLVVQNPQLPVVVTSNIDIFSYESIVFDNFYVQQASTNPSRVSLMTSRRPDTHRVYDNCTYWRTETGNFTTLPEYFKSNGYHTMSIGNVFLSGDASKVNNDHPFSWSDEPFHPYTERFENGSHCLFINGTSLRYVSNAVCPIITKNQPCATLPDMETAWAAQTYIKAAAKTMREFFLVIGFTRPQVPLKFPVHNLWHYNFKSIRLPKNRIRATVPPVAWNPYNNIRSYFDIKTLNLSYPYEIMPDNYTRLMRQCYYASVSYIDGLIGDILRELVLQNLYDNTIIGIVGDRGLHLGDSGMWGGETLYDVALRTPLILRIPNVTSSPHMRFRKICHNLVEEVDLFPTLVDAAELNPLELCSEENALDSPLCTEGSSLMPIIHAYSTDPSLSKVKIMWKPAVFSQIPRGNLYPTLFPDSVSPKRVDITVMGYSIRTERYKYIEWIPFNGYCGNYSESIVMELYDFSIDPTESLNLAYRPQLQFVVQKLRDKLIAGWRTCLPQIEYF